MSDNGLVLDSFLAAARENEARLRRRSEEETSDPVIRWWVRHVAAPWLSLQLLQTRARVRVIGISGGPGAGKTSLAAAMRICLAAAGLRAAVLSAEDYYFPRADLLQRGMKWRALPGSHDNARMLSDLTRLLEQKERVILPRFSMMFGHHVEPEEITPPVSVVIIEGMLIGSALAGGYGQIGGLVDYRLHLTAPIESLRRWRFERERLYRSLNPAAGISDADMERFWDEALLPTVLTCVEPLASTADLEIRFGHERHITHALPRSGSYA